MQKTGGADRSGACGAARTSEEGRVAGASAMTGGSRYRERLALSPTWGAALDAGALLLLLLLNAFRRRRRRAGRAGRRRNWGAALDAAAAAAERL